MIDPDGVATDDTSPAAGTVDEPTPDEVTDHPAAKTTLHRRQKLALVAVFGVLPTVAVLLAGFAGFLKWTTATAQAGETARVDSTRAAMASTVALLSYRPDTVEQDLDAARDRLTGDFRDSYSSLIKDVVIPGAKEKKISAVATVPAATSLLANTHHAEVLLFVNQTTIFGDGAPTHSASTVKVTMDRIGERWLISKFEPI